MPRSIESLRQERESSEKTTPGPKLRQGKRSGPAESDPKPPSVIETILQSPGKVLRLSGPSESVWARWIRRGLDGMRPLGYGVLLTTDGRERWWATIVSPRGHQSDARFVPRAGAGNDLQTWLRAQVASGAGGRLLVMVPVDAVDEEDLQRIAQEFEATVLVACGGKGEPVISPR